jgi:hypothetical protein
MSCQDKVQTAEMIKIHPRSKFITDAKNVNKYIKIHPQIDEDWSNSYTQTSFFNISIPHDIYVNCISDKCVKYYRYGEVYYKLYCGRNAQKFFTNIYKYLQQNDPIKAEKLKYRVEHFTH